MRICADASFLIELYDERDRNRRRTKAIECFEEYLAQPNVLVLTWPVVYESISSQMAKSKQRMESIDRSLKSLLAKRQLQFLDDAPFRISALEECFLHAGTADVRRYRPLSLVDRVIRGILADVNSRIDALATFDAQDFSDVCRKYRKQIIP